MASLPIPDGIASTMFQQINPLLGRLRVAQDEVSRLLVTQVENPRRTLMRWRDEQARIDDAFKSLEIIQREWANEAVGDVYKRALKDAENEIKALSKITHNPKKLVSEIMNEKNTDVLTQLFDDRLTSPFSAGAERGKKYAKSWVRELSQTLVNRDDLDFNMLRGLSSSGGDLNKVISSLRLQLINQGRENAMQSKFIRVGGRNMRPDAYAELLARTRFHELQSEAALVQAKNYDAPYMKISKHGGPSDICKQFEGKIYRISDVESAAEIPLEKRNSKTLRLPPYHPNCRHTAHPQFLDEGVEDVA